MTVIQLHIYYLVYSITQITDLLQSIQFTVHFDTNSNTVTYIQSHKLQIYCNPFNLQFSLTLTVIQLHIYYAPSHKLQIYCNPFNLQFSLTLTVIQLHIYNPTNYRYIVIHSIYGSF